MGGMASLHSNSYGQLPGQRIVGLVELGEGAERSGQPPTAAMVLADCSSGHFGSTAPMGIRNHRIGLQVSLQVASYSE